MAAKLKKGDLVEVIVGKDRGARGKIMEIDGDRVRVEGIAIQKRHVKAGTRQSLPQGGIIDRPGLIHRSNVRLYSEKLGRGVRVGFKVLEGGEKVRVARGRAGESKVLD